MENQTDSGARVLIVEDEPEIASLVAYHLEKAGYVVSIAAEGEEAVTRARSERPALIILDLMLPGISGFQVLEVIRGSDEIRDTAVLMLTALREDEDRIRGLSLGVDDYVTKPFNPEELVLRVGAILRRVGSQNASVKVLTAGPISVDPFAHRVTVSGAEVDLTSMEYRLLLLLIQQPGRVVGRPQLLEGVWAAVPDLQTRTVDVHVQRLRSKLGAAGAMIETIRGHGYRIKVELQDRVGL